MAELDIGDAVILNNHPHDEPAEAGMIGEIVAEYKDNFGIDFGPEFDGHNCDIDDHENSCWWISKKGVEPCGD